ncbi:FAD:protein FMN transferase [Paracraurococcus lichenis]|uniref:FAD:protein FMN transferase n=1 Tax=Paracraurococcus lichenis TaxID=3064888 RepID=A0ABT9E0P0_9PROT|nr:FAD:protein FMN transferase [Paracraurococcus sp. LOR1-02]MDO9709734.1 FAD:protein FMN transferase [Paracraurococcus sp. LOR1-02]
MRRRSLGLAVGLLAWPARAERGLVEARRLGLAFGTTFSIRALHAEARVLQAALDAAVAELRSVQAVLSLFDPDSQLSRLNREGMLRRPDPVLLAVLAEARALWAATAGAFDPTIQPLWRLWAEASARGARPSEAALAEARALVDFAAVEADADGLRFRRAGMGLTLNGIAQGHAADRVAAVLRAAGIADALVDAGEFAALGRRGDSAPWQVGIRDPRRGTGLVGSPVTLEGCLAVSGDDECAFTADRSEHHILDPRTGHSPRDLALLAVRAPRAALADGLSTAGFVVGPARAEALAARFGASVEAWVTKDGAVRRPG